MGKDLIPRTPVREEDVEQNGDDKGENPSSREAAQNSDNHVEVEKTESNPDRIIPNGKTIPRTPGIQQSNKTLEIEERCTIDGRSPAWKKSRPESERMIRAGKNIPRTPALQQSNKSEIQDNDEKSAKDEDNEEENKKSGLDPEKII